MGEVRDNMSSQASSTGSNGSVLWSNGSYVTGTTALSWDDGSSALSTRSEQSGGGGSSSLKRTNSSPNFEKSQQGLRRDVKPSSLARVPSPRRDRKPLVLEIDSAHLRNFKPDYGTVYYGKCG